MHALAPHAQPGCLDACSTLEPAFKSAFCAALGQSCSLVVVECVKGMGYPQDMNYIRSLPLSVRQAVAAGDE